MPRGRPDPFGQVADGGGIHLVPDPQILEQDRAQLDEAQRGLASGDDGVHAGTVAVVGTDAAIAVTVEGRCIAARPTIAFACDEIDERGFLGLLHGLPPFATLGTRAAGAGRWSSLSGDSGGPGSAGWPSIGGQCATAKRVFRSRRPRGGRPLATVASGRLGRFARYEIERQRAQLVDDRVGRAQRVALERAGPGG